MRKALAVFVFAIPKPTIQSLAIITGLHWAPTIYVNSVSNVATYMKLAEKSGAKIDGAISVGYIKDPTDPQWTNDDGMKLYRQVIANCSTCDSPRPVMNSDARWTRSAPARSASGPAQTPSNIGCISRGGPGRRMMACPSCSYGSVRTSTR